MQQGQHGEPSGLRVGTGAQLGLVYPARRPATQFESMEPLVQPLPHPFLLQEPVGIGFGIAQGEFLAGLHIQRAGREIGSTFAGRQQLGVESQGHPVSVAFGIGRRQFHQPRPRPVGRPFVEQVTTVRMPLSYPQKRHWNPGTGENGGSLGGVE